MTVHLFPTGQELAERGEVARDRTMELWLIAGLISATAAQAALFVWFWMG